jgi:hypothetical protein
MLQSAFRIMRQLRSERLELDHLAPPRARSHSEWYDRPIRLDALPSTPPKRDRVHGPEWLYPRSWSAFRSIPTTTARSVGVLLAVDQELGEGAGLGVTPVGADRLGAIEVWKSEDVEEFGSSRRRERLRGGLEVGA